MYPGKFLNPRRALSQSHSARSPPWRVGEVVLLLPFCSRGTLVSSLSFMNPLSVLGENTCGGECVTVAGAGGREALICSICPF